MFDFTILYWIPLLIVIWWLISKGSKAASLQKVWANDIHFEGNEIVCRLVVDGKRMDGVIEDVLSFNMSELIKNGKIKPFSALCLLHRQYDDNHASLTMSDEDNLVIFSRIRAQKNNDGRIIYVGSFRFEGRECSGYAESLLTEAMEKAVRQENCDSELFIRCINLVFEEADPVWGQRLVPIMRVADPKTNRN
jgi:hypothetical protein